MHAEVININISVQLWPLSMHHRCNGSFRPRVSTDTLSPPSPMQLKRTQHMVMPPSMGNTWPVM
jgi:hypothetical protein